MIIRHPNTPKFDIAPKPENLILDASLSAPEQTSLLRDLLRDKISYVYLPSLNQDRLLYPHLSIVHWIIFTGNLTNLRLLLEQHRHLILPHYDFPLVHYALLCNQMTVAECLVNENLGGWGAHYMADWDILFTTLYGGHVSLAHDLVRLGHTNWDKPKSLQMNYLWATLSTRQFEFTDWLIRELQFPVRHELPITTVLENYRELKSKVDSKELAHCELSLYAPLESKTADDLAAEAKWSFSLLLSMRSDEIAMRWLVNETHSKWEETDGFGIAIFMHLAAFAEFDTLNRLLCEGLIKRPSQTHLVDGCVLILTAHKFDIFAQCLARDYFVLEDDSKSELISLICQSKDRIAIDWLVAQNIIAWDSFDIRGYQIFHHAIEANYGELCDWLVTEGYNSWQDRTAPIDDLRGDTALPLAIKKRQTALVQRLLTEGHYRFEYDSDDSNAFEDVIKSGNVALANWLVEEGYAAWSNSFPDGSSLAGALATGWKTSTDDPMGWDFQELKRLIDQGHLDPHFKDNLGYTLLRHLLHLDNFSVLARARAITGLTWDDTDNTGSNLLHDAIEYVHTIFEPPLEIAQWNEAYSDELCLQIACHAPHLILTRANASMPSPLALIANEPNRQALFLKLSSLQDTFDQLKQAAAKGDTNALLTTMDRDVAIHFSRETYAQVLHVCRHDRTRTLINAELALGDRLVPKHLP